MAYVRWAEEVDEQCAHIPDAAARLNVRGIAYLRWAQENPDAYSALFVRAWQADSDRSVYGPGFDKLLDDLAEVHNMDHGDARLLTVAFTYWASIHGLACLTIAIPQFDSTTMWGTLNLMGQIYGAVDATKVPTNPAQFLANTMTAPLVAVAG
ncbi:MAG: TetR-like C-terminal domain-containing protein [Arachnia sp.]